jgi:hypothetical protein
VLHCFGTVEPKGIAWLRQRAAVAERLINLKTAKALGITMLPSLLLLADEAIQ